MDVSEFMETSNPQRRLDAINEAEEALDACCRKVAELHVAEAALRLLDCFVDDKERLPGKAKRPARVEFSFDPEGHAVAGGSADVLRVYNSEGEVIWSESDEQEFEIESDVTDYLASAVEAYPSFFDKPGDDVYACDLPTT